MPNHAILDPNAHRDLRIVTSHGEALGDGVMTALVVPAEFRQAQSDYPILFRLNLERDSFSAVALFGFEAGENLFLEDGRWDARNRPLSIDIQPFLIGRGPDASSTRQVHIDLDSPRIAADGEGVRLFDEGGRPTPYLEAVSEKLKALDAGYEASAPFFDALRRHELLEPLSVEITLDDGSTHRLVGFHIIDEKRLRGLDAQALGELHSEGHLMPLFMALASLGRLGELVARKNRRLQGG